MCMHEINLLECTVLCIIHWVAKILPERFLLDLNSTDDVKTPIAK